MAAPLFRNIQFQGWRQYKSIDLDLHPRLTILTGANGAGKTTILNILGMHFGWGTPLVSTPRRPKGFEGTRYFTDLWDSKLLDALGELFDDYKPIPVEPEPMGPEREIGSIRYTTEHVAQLRVPTDVSPTYNISIPGRQDVKGLYIPSHRPLYAYQQVQSIPTQPRTRSEIFNQYMGIVRNRYLGQHHQWTPNYYIKETLIALATFGYGNAVVTSDAKALETFERFQEVLGAVLPPTLGFKRLIIRMPEVVLVTKSGEFSIDAVSGGVASIIDMAWQIFMYSPDEDEFAVVIDEPENHLHPELQRTVLGSLLEAFPTLQFVVATHNPFIVGSVPDSNVYVLDYDANQRVFSTYLDTANRAGTSNEILRNVLGLSFTIPVWVERRLEAVIEEFSNQELTTDSLQLLRSRLNDLGMEQYIPDTIAKVVQRSQAQ